MSLDMIKKPSTKETVYYKAVPDKCYDKPLGGLHLSENLLTFSSYAPNVWCSYTLWV